MVLVDSSIWIEALRREGRIEEKVGLECLLDEYEAMWCGPIKLEVLGGARQQERKRLRGYFDSIPYRSMRDPDWDFAVENYWRLRDAGHTLPFNDVLIGSLSLRWICRVYARDRHFEIMRDVLGVRLYRAGYGGKFDPDAGG